MKRVVIIAMLFSCLISCKEKKIVDESGFYYMVEENDTLIVMESKIQPKREGHELEGAKNLVSFLMKRQQLKLQKAFGILFMANVPILYVDDIKDFARAMKDLKQINVSTDTYMITSHGSEQSFYIGSDEISWSTDLSELKSGLEGKNVVINACDVAKNDSRGCGSTFVESLAADIGGTVFASPQAVKGWSAFRFTPLVTKGDNGQYSNVFYKSSNGTQATIVKNLVVNKMYKISHDRYALPIY